MSSALRILVTGARSEDLEQVRSALAGQSDMQVELRLWGDGHVDPLAGVARMPDIHVAILGDAWLRELDVLDTHAAPERPPMIAIGAHDDIRVVRKAMQAGARDYLTLPVAAGEMVEAVREVASELGPRGATTSSIIAVLDAKGGSGASFVATSLAHIMAAHLGRRTALIDLDIQFGKLDLCLDLKPRTGLLQALSGTDRLDATALDSYMTRHASGLRLLASVSDRLAFPWELSADRLGELLAVAGRAYDQVIVDLPRQIDPLTGTVLERADHVYLIVEQSLIHVRDARRMLDILNRDLAVAPSQVRVIINRYDPKSPVSRKDILQALRIHDAFLIPNDFRRVSESMNLGVPIFESAPTAPVSRALAELAAATTGVVERKEGALRRVFASLLENSKGSHA